MALSLPFYGGELSAFTPLNAGITESTTAGTFNSSVSRCAITGLFRPSYADSPAWTAAPSMWFHGLLWLDERSGGGKPNNSCISFYSGSTLVAYLKVSDTPPDMFSWWQLTLYTLQSGSLTALSQVAYAPTNTLGFAALQNIDMQFVAGASGAASLYINGNLVISATGLDHSGWSSGITSVRIPALDDNNFGIVTGCCWSQIICDTVCTIGRLLFTDNFSNESATNTAWTAYGGGTKLANTNKIVWNDATGMDATTTGQTDTFYQSGLSFGSYNILARGVSARAGYYLSAPTQVYLVVRISSTNYLSSAVALPNYYQATFYSWGANPNTSAAWTPSTAASIEAGVQSLT
jgi:hypothetical protein